MSSRQGGTGRGPESLENLHPKKREPWGVASRRPGSGSPETVGGPGGPVAPEQASSWGLLTWDSPRGLRGSETNAVIGGKGGLSYSAQAVPQTEGPWDPQGDRLSFLPAWKYLGAQGQGARVGSPLSSGVARAAPGLSPAQGAPVAPQAAPGRLGWASLCQRGKEVPTFESGLAR